MESCGNMSCSTMITGYETVLLSRLLRSHNSILGQKNVKAVPFVSILYASLIFNWNFFNLSKFFIDPFTKCHKTGP